MFRMIFPAVLVLLVLTGLLIITIQGIVDEQANAGGATNLRLLSSPVSSDEEEGPLTVLLFSDRIEGIITTIGSMIRSTSSPFNIILIGQPESNEKAQMHFRERTNSFITMTIGEAQEDLVAQGQNPIWSWKEWHSSRDPVWKNNNTIHVAEWDNLHTHDHELNHLRFYIPYLSVVRDVKDIFFIDDDVLIQKDLGEVFRRVDAKDAGLTCPCNIWVWNDQCHHFDFKSKHINIMEASPLYGGRPKCQTDDEDFCLPDNFESFVNQSLPSGHADPEDQTAWNFGFCLFHMNNWKKMELTEKYENAMKVNYQFHEVPETSLVFGLGIPFLAFAGAVQCWDEGVLKVRDGFGFIDWQRYQKTFGDAFFSSVDVAHYTGPKKPWVPFTTIEAPAAEPWLEMMKLEGMDIPEQLPEMPTNKLFQLMTSYRSGSEWFMTMLDQHSTICASGETQRPETGFPTESMLGMGTPWIPVCALKRGCTFGFVRDSIFDWVNFNLTNSVCEPDFKGSGDSPEFLQYPDHRKRICNFVDALQNNFTVEAIIVEWVQAFANEDKNFLGCGCPRGTQIKGLKVMVDWIHTLTKQASKDPKHIPNLEETSFNNQKVIRLKRANLWERYKSLLKAQVTESWHARSADATEQKAEIHVPVEKAMANIDFMKKVDDNGDQWALKHGSGVLFVDYEECKASPIACRTTVFEFLGVDSAESSKIKDSISAFAKAKDPLDGITNKAETREALGANGFGMHIGLANYTQLQLLVFETDPLEKMKLADRHVKRTDEMKGINVTVIGQGKTFHGYGSKYAAAKPVLGELPPDSLVVLSDSRDVITNIHQKRHFGLHMRLYSSIIAFRKAYNTLTKSSPGAIVVSTEAQCCVTALGHVEPGDLFSKDGSRTGYACSSGPSCAQKEVENALPWHDFMKEHATKHGKEKLADIYLNAGLIAGKAKDLLAVIEALDIQEDEDDQAVLTAFMYRNPHSIVLDYDQSMFGTNRWASDDESCMFDFPLALGSSGSDDTLLAGRRLVHTETGASPLFIHSPGEIIKCHYQLLDKLNPPWKPDKKGGEVNEDSKPKPLYIQDPTSNIPRRLQFGADTDDDTTRSPNYRISFNRPSQAPSFSPTFMSSATVVSISSSLSLSEDIDCSNPILTYLQAAILEIILASLNERQILVEMRVWVCDDIELDNIELEGGLGGRQLISYSDKVRYSFKIQQFCSDLDCGANEAQVGNQVAGQIFEATTKEAILETTKQKAIAGGNEDLIEGIRIASISYGETVTTETVIASTSGNTEAETPTASSIMPSLSPSNALVVHYWYPKWDGDNPGSDYTCLNDGQQSNYMENSPDAWLFENLDDCCKKYFQFAMVTCRKNSIDQLKWYPTLDVNPGGCANDGLEPLYMKRSAEENLFDSSLECCEAFYPWMIDVCMNPIVDPCSQQYPYLGLYDSSYKTKAEQGYYPDFTKGNYCLKIGEDPEYMNFNFDKDEDSGLEGGWKHQTLEQCCLQNFHYEFDECMGDTTNGSEQDRIVDPCPDPLPGRSGKWYVQYYHDDALRCVKDCVGPEPCDNRPTLFKELYDTFHICCEVHLWHDDVPCTSRDDNGFILEEEDCTDSYWDTESNELVTTNMIYYASPTTCLRDDAQELFHIKLSTDVWKYPSLAECCYNNFHWQFKECMAYEEDNALEPCSPPPEYSLKWYTRTVTNKSGALESECVQECDGPAPCNGRASSYDELYDTFSACCKLFMYWKQDQNCMVP